jgi:hypothetical protein
MSGVGVAAAPCTKTRMPLVRRDTSSGPDIPGITTSVSSRSKGCWRASVSPASPLDASSTR